MIEQVDLLNFRCFANVQVPMKPLTVLIGPNDSGKSTFLQALSLLSHGSACRTTDFHQFDPELDVDLMWNSNGSWQGIRRRQGTNEHVGNDLPRPKLEIFDSLEQGVRMTGPGVSDEKASPTLGADGSQVPALLDYLYRVDQARFRRIEEEIKKLVPNVAGLQVRTPTAADRRVDFVLENNVTINGDSMSAGVRLFTFFVSLAYHPSPPDIICVEEPENGVHPRRLQEITDLLKGMTEGEHVPKPTQVVLS